MVQLVDTYLKVGIMSCDCPPEVFGSILRDANILYLSDISWSCDLLLESGGLCWTTDSSGLLQWTPDVTYLESG